jgi:hypothetical protein
MLEAALLILLATGGLWALVQWQRQHQNHAPSDTDDEPQIVSIIAEGGLFGWGKPGEQPTLQAFQELHLVPGGVALRASRTMTQHVIPFAEIQWVSHIDLQPEGIATVTLHLERGGRWHLLRLQIVESHMAIFAKVLRQAVSGSRLNLGNLRATPIGPVAARVVEENLQGETSLGAEVGLYLLPHLLVVLRGDMVQAKLDTSSIRRVLSVERNGGALDSLLKTPEGIVRLYSLRETASFALPQYQELAEEIGYLARCPVEFITQEDKLRK